MTPPMTQDVEEAVGRLDYILSQESPQRVALFAYRSDGKGTNRPVSITVADLRLILSAILAQKRSGAVERERVVFRGALADIADECCRHVEVEGWTASHDDEHTGGEMAKAAACYAAGQIVSAIPQEFDPDRGAAGYRSIWPWDMKWWKPKTYRRNLVRAGSLIVAEINRIDRLTHKPGCGARESLARLVEKVLFRRAIEKRLDGYTSETSQEIADAILGWSVMPVVPEKVSLIDGLYGPHEWGYRCPVEGGFIADDRPYRAADRIALLEEALRGVGDEARRYAEFYPQSSDGRNTFVIFAEWADRQAAQALAETEVGGE